MIKYTTLWDIMKSFDLKALIEIDGILGVIAGVLIGSNTVDRSHQTMPRDQVKGFCRQVTKAKKQFHKLGLTLSEISSERMRSLLSQTSVTYGEINEIGNQLYDRIVDELKSKTVFSVEAPKQHLLIEKNLFGMEVTTAFPSAIIDIEEAGKCLALERTTACVFHLMRVMEVGLHVLGDTLKLPSSTNRTWDAILDKCGKEQAKPFKDKEPEWQSNGTFLAGVAAMLWSVKDAWRNPTMHIEKVYTEGQAEDIWNAVRGFMRHLATRLKEDMP